MFLYTVDLVKTNESILIRCQIWLDWYLIITHATTMISGHSNQRAASSHVLPTVAQLMKDPIVFLDHCALC